MSWAVLGLGTNLGSRRAILEGAIALLGSRVLARSALYATPPLGPPQPDYLNAAVRIAWEGDPHALLAEAHGIEQQLGRERRVRWGPRTLDVDILWAHGLDLKSEPLSVPHPELTRRPFALAPLLDVAPELAMRDVLATLGGPPPRALPRWSRLVREGSDLCGEWLHDASELAAQQIALLTAGRACTGKLEARAFSGASSPDGDAWLFDRAQAAWSAGFAVRAAAVLHRDEHALRGVLLGLPGSWESPPSAVARIERRADGSRRWAIELPPLASSWP